MPTYDPAWVAAYEQKLKRAFIEGRNRSSNGRKKAPKTLYHSRGAYANIYP